MCCLPEKKAGKILYAAMYEELKKQNESGAFPAGTKLPSQRTLGTKLGVSVNTVRTAYTQLELEGFVEVRPKSGFYVCNMESLQKIGSQRGNPMLTPLEKQCDQNPEEAKNNFVPANVAIDFAPAAIAKEKFPSTQWYRCLRSCLEDPRALERTPPQGDLDLRQILADSLYTERGVECTPQQVILGAGTDSLLEILSYILPNQWALAMENPVYTKAYRLFSRMGHRVVPIQVDKQGVMTEPLEGLDQLLVYTTPSHQYPLGTSMPVGRRIQLLNWAGRGKSRFIVEDDYDSEFRYDAKPVPSLQSIDQNERVIYLTSFSRSVAPALRLSVMVLPDSILKIYHETYKDFVCRVSTLEQLTLGEFIRRGFFESHLNRMRTYYKNKCKRLLQGLKPLRDTVDLVGELAGQHLTLQVRNGMTEEQLWSSALDVGVRVYPVSPFFMTDFPESSMVLLGFGGLKDEEIDEGTKRLVMAWHK